jgi:hypothetical protein
MKKLFVFAVAFIAFTGFTFSGKNETVANNTTTSVSANVAHDFTYFRTHHQSKKNVVLDWGIDSPAVYHVLPLKDHMMVNFMMSSTR